MQKEKRSFFLQRELKEEQSNPVTFSRGLTSRVGIQSSRYPFIGKLIPLNVDDASSLFRFRLHAGEVNVSPVQTKCL
jgi:hypothetical protein